MADFGTTMKNAWVRGMEAIGAAANNLASSTKFKVNEMNLSNQRKEILDSFGEKAYALWKSGAFFPDELDSLMKQVESLDQQLEAVRAEHAAARSDESAAPKAPVMPEVYDRDFKEPVQDDTAPSLDLPTEEAPMEQIVQEVSESIGQATEEISRLGEQVSDQVDQIVEQLNQPEA